MNNTHCMSAKPYRVCKLSPPPLPVPSLLAVQEGSEEHPDSLCAPASPGAAPPRSSAQHPQARGWSVLQGAAGRPQGQEAVCHLRGTQEGNDNQDFLLGGGGGDTQESNDNTQ